MKSWNFTIVPVPGDGNCFFHAIYYSIEHLLIMHPSLASVDVFKQFLETTDNCRIDFLRKLLVKEWLGDRRAMYEACYAGQDYSTEAKSFECNGYFDSELGDMMASGICNALHITVCLLTSLKHQPDIVFSPDEGMHGVYDPVNIYLAYNAHGKGHYDSLTYVESPKNLKSACRCGVNSKVDSKWSCTYEDKSTKYRSRCPCLQQGLACTNKCGCLRCENPHGKRSLQATRLSTHQRKRSAYDYQGPIPSSKKFALQRKEVLKTGKWTILENFVLALIIREMKIKDPADAFFPFNLVVQEAKSMLSGNEDSLCPRSIRSLSAKMVCTESARRLSFTDLYMRLQDCPDKQTE